MTVSTDFDFESTTYREKTQSFDIDPLVLSVRLKKFKDNNFVYIALQDQSLKEMVTEEDYVDARNIKEYYNRKVLFEAIKRGQLSDYRKAMLSLLDTQKNSLSPREMGLFVTLPYFYEEDIKLESFKTKYNTETVKRVTPNLVKQTRRLEYIDVTKRFMNKQLHKRYWFANQDQELCMIDLNSAGNVLCNFFESYILKHKLVELNCNAAAEFYPLPYYKIFDFRLE